MTPELNWSAGKVSGAAAKAEGCSARESIGWSGRVSASRKITLESSVRFHACRAARRTSHFSPATSQGSRRGVVWAGGGLGGGWSGRGGAGRGGEAAHVELGARGEPLGFLLLILGAQVIAVLRHMGAEHLVAADRSDLDHLPRGRGQQLLASVSGQAQAQARARAQARAQARPRAQAQG
jgi:hypothetical protein